MRKGAPGNKMASRIIGLLTETSMHVGTGQTTGGIDLPVARERTTGYPVIFGSGLKGALRQRAEDTWGLDEPKVKEIFGEPDQAGAVSVTDARLLLLPVRSLQGPFRWVTCPYVLDRYRRDCRLGGTALEPFRLAGIAPGRALAADAGTLFLEELTFEAERADLEALAREMGQLIFHPSLRERLLSVLTVVSDEDFGHLARFALPVNAHNVLNDTTKTSENLWYEETVPPETLFYALLLTRSADVRPLEYLVKLFEHYPYLQVGGNETVGQGWCVVSLVGGGGNHETVG
jgi:CRISPR-associated protein Cmr4